jgi:hypothetical protein
MSLWEVEEGAEDFERRVKGYYISNLGQET